ncbi:hypothetical protein GEMRC1_011154 [Eukaryota sp. GEM-RC1]
MTNLSLKWGLLCGVLFISKPSSIYIDRVLQPLAQACSLEQNQSISTRDVFASIEGFRYLFNPVAASLGLFLGPTALIPCAVAFRLRFDVKKMFSKRGLSKNTV